MTPHREALPKNTPISKIYDYVFLLEDILFSSDEEAHLDYSKLDKQSPFYDAEYEAAMRKKELNVLYLLDEIIFFKTKHESEGLDILNEIESVLFSPNFYRELLFKEPSFPFRIKIEKLCKVIKENTNYIKDAVSKNEYKNIILIFEYLSPPPTKEKFLADLEGLASFLKERSKILDSM